MNRIVITLPEFQPGEGARIEHMLSTGALRVHIRKPGATEEQVRGLIESISRRFYHRISLHDHLDLAVEYGLGGVHLNSRYPAPPPDFSGLVSRSCHSISELREHNDLDYLFLSPIFNSISKKDYKSAFSDQELQKAKSDGILDSHVYALGGVRPALFGTLAKYGFGGAALMGAAWNPIDASQFRIQYIAPDSTNVEAMLKQGCRWVQLRMKDARSPEILRHARIIAPLCRKYGATFVLDDRVDLVEATGADGVHLGANDIPVDQARQILGPGYIIGATANDFSAIEKATNSGADYVGLGPLRFTTTKKNLSPILGYEGYDKIMEQVRNAHITLPVTAIGGIVPSDLERLWQAGVHGVAASGAIESILLSLSNK